MMTKVHHECCIELATIECRLKEVSVRHGAENTNEDGRQDESAEQTLDEDGVLNLAQRRLLNPNLAIENFADDVALGVFGDPRLVFEGVAA